jgi:hypothetical protein
MEDLEEAIRMVEQAVEATPEDPPDLAMCLENLTNGLAERFERTRRIKDLEGAVRKAEQAVDVTPKDHPALPARMDNLGNNLARRYERTGR